MWCAAKLALCGRQEQHCQRKEGPSPASAGSWRLWLSGTVDRRGCHTDGALHTPIFFIQIISCLLECHGGEYLCHGATLHYVIGDGEGLRKVIIKSALTVQVDRAAGSPSVEHRGDRQIVSGWAAVHYCSLRQTLLWGWQGSRLTVPCFVSGVDGGRAPWPLCFCWLWSHTGFQVGFIRRWLARACWAGLWQILCQQWRVRWSHGNWSNQTYHPCSSTVLPWRHRKNLVSTCPVFSSKKEDRKVCYVASCCQGSWFLVGCDHHLLLCDT